MQATKALGFRGLRPAAVLLQLAAMAATLLQGALAQEVVRLGAGSYATAPPPRGKEPPATIYATENVQGKMPTNDWWSSLAWVKFSERHYPHPLAVQATSAGLRVYYPGNSIASTRDAIFAFMPAGTGDDLVLGHSAQAQFPDARVDGFSDWFVSVRFGDGPRRMRVSYGHGSPFVYAMYEGGTAQIAFPKAPEVWSGNGASAVLGITMGGKHYGLFGPSGSTWDGLGTKLLTCRTSRQHFSLAILPEKSEECLAMFRRSAHSHVTDTRVGWSYEPKTSEVVTQYHFTTTAHEGNAQGTLFALYPHQWRHSPVSTLRWEYRSVRGRMKLGQGTSFQTRMRFPGVLPALPNVGACDPERLAGYIRAELTREPGPVRDTYGEGKWLGRLATALPIAEQYGLEDLARLLRDRIQERLESWLTAAGPDGRVKDRGLFSYNGRWGTLIGYPASFGSDTELNDHHFHYGYFIKAAAEVARLDPAWGSDSRWGPMVKLLIRDFASSDRRDPLFPFLRNFDPYAGHSWASGHAKFGDGNNQESSSEAMNAWCGIILWGEATGDASLRDLGIYLYTTEMAAIQEYWFDVHGENHPKQYTPSVVTMVWGGKGANGTWFSANPECVHGINWLPIHGGSLYLGHFPGYAQRNYEALVAENGGTRWDAWADVVWMYRAFSDPDDAIRQFEAAAERFPAEAGNSLANTYHWLHTLKRLGRVDPTVTADWPLYAVFQNDRTRTYLAFTMRDEPRTITFSDGFQLRASRKGMVSGTQDQ